MWGCRGAGRGTGQWEKPGWDAAPQRPQPAPGRALELGWSPELLHIQTEESGLCPPSPGRVDHSLRWAIPGKGHGLVQSSFLQPRSKPTEGSAVSDEGLRSQQRREGRLVRKVVWLRDCWASR